MNEGKSWTRKGTKRTLEEVVKEGKYKVVPPSSELTVIINNYMKK